MPCPQVHAHVLGKPVIPIDWRKPRVVVPPGASVGDTVKDVTMVLPRVVTIVSGGSNVVGTLVHD